MLTLGENLSLPPEAVTQTFGVLAVRGAGKSNLAAVMAEEMHAAHLPFVVIDPVGSWWGLRSSADGTGPGLSIPIFGGRHGDLPLERTAGAEVADLVVDERASCVLDLSEFSESDKIRFLIDFAERLYRRNEAPLHLLLEEADDYIPQRPFRVQARLLRAWENIVRRGRARGLGMTMITQRSAAINKSVLTQIETLFVLRTTSPQDRKAIEAWVDYQGQRRDVLDTLPTLASGEAWVWSPNWLKAFERVKIRRRHTFDSASTPKALKGGRKPATLADIDLGAVRKRFAASIERAKAEDPRELRKEIAALKRQLAEKPAAPAAEVRVEVPVLTDEQEEALGEAVGALESVSEYLKDVAKDFGRAQESYAIAQRALSEILAAVARATAAPAPPQRATTAAPAPRASVTPVASAARQRQATFAPAGRASKGGTALPLGERLILTACAQYPDGCGRDQLSILTGYKRSTRDAYVLRLRERGLAEVSGDCVIATQAGVDALGADFEPLPTGDRLRDYWMDKLPDGERKVLGVVCAAFPEACERSAIDELTDFKRSTRDAYILRLKARRLVTLEGRGSVKASAELFA